MTPVDHAYLTGASADPNSSHKPHDHVLTAPPCEENRAFRVSWFDSVTSSLMALMIFVATFVGMLLIVWLIDSEPTDELVQQHQVRSVSIHYPKGLEHDFLDPGAVEVEQLLDSSVEDLLMAVSDSASLVAGAWVTSSTHQNIPTEGENGLGDSRKSVSPTGDIEGLPAFQRWQLNFSARDLRSYARQLDHFGIELGVVGGQVQGVDYVRDLSSVLTTRRDSSETEQRLYFMWNQPGPLMHYDRRLLSRAGVELPGREVLKFISPELENRLTQIELEYARSVGRDSLSDIAKTVFESYPAGDGYQFKVIAQRYVRPRN
ncbi:MAG: hypothetical protein AAF497_23525 [Planctomycetota bacterium]